MYYKHLVVQIKDISVYLAPQTTFGGAIEPINKFEFAKTGHLLLTILILIFLYI